MASASQDDDFISGINVTPLVDVVLVLLIIFLITAPTIYQASIKVNLPKAKSGEAGSKSPLSFTLSKDGSLYWDKNLVAWDTMPSRLRGLGEHMTDETAVINADNATPHGTVVRLMDLLRQAGLSKFSLSVQSQR